jgi:hypothetical protein
VSSARLDLTREQILTYRRSVNALDERLAPSPMSLRRAAWAGLQDSMPRAAVLSIHARVQETGPDTWQDRSLVQLWGPRFSAYVVAARDVAVFSLGRLPDDPVRRRFAADLAGRLHAFLGGRTITYGEAGRGLGVHPNQLRYAAPTGRVLIRWDGARQPTIWTVPAPDVDPADARLELARRYLHVFGPATPAAFAQWAGIRPPAGHAAFDALVGSLAPARLLPSGDAYFLLQGADREILVPDSDRRRELWTPRVWPGAVLVEGDIVGTWRRAQADVTIASWRRLSPSEREAVEAEAAALPLSIPQRVRVLWDH